MPQLSSSSPEDTGANDELKSYRREDDPENSEVDVVNDIKSDLLNREPSEDKKTNRGLTDARFGRLDGTGLSSESSAFYGRVTSTSGCRSGDELCTPHGASRIGPLEPRGHDQVAPLPMCPSSHAPRFHPVGFSPVGPHVNMPYMRPGDQPWHVPVISGHGVHPYYHQEHLRGSLHPDIRPMSLPPYYSPMASQTFPCPVSSPISHGAPPARVSADQGRDLCIHAPTRRIKKPLNAFMLFMKENRGKIASESTLKESAAINQILGKQWQALGRDQQQKYYDLAKIERQRHLQMYPGWSARDSYPHPTKKRKRKKEKSLNGGDNNPKKCRARYGLEHQELWCKPCKRKKKCERFGSGSGEGDDKADAGLGAADPDASHSDRVRDGIDNCDAREDSPEVGDSDLESNGDGSDVEEDGDEDLDSPAVALQYPS